MPDRPSVIACIDESSYAGAVCEYGAWVAEAMQAPLWLLHVAEPGEAAGLGPRLLDEAAQRLADHGVAHTRALNPGGNFAETAMALSAEKGLLVLGKRGARSAVDRQLFGSNVDPIARGATEPVLLVSTLFLPVSRALALLDADPEHRRTVEFVHAQPWLSALELDLMVMTDGGGGAAKLAWARQMLRARTAGVFPVPVEGPHEALARYWSDRPVDLLILSREIALAGGAERLDKVEADSLWARRAPVLIC